MNRSTSTADALAVASTHARPADRPRGRGDAPATRTARDLPRESRVSHVFRTLGRGLVAEHDPA